MRRLRATHQQQRGHRHADRLADIAAQRLQRRGIAAQRRRQVVNAITVIGLNTKPMPKPCSSSVTIMRDCDTSGVQSLME